MVSFDQQLRRIVRDEVSRAVAPLRAALAGLLEALPGGRGPRGPYVRPWRVCALGGCGRPARSKGFCPAHYQKYRMLERTGRLPRAWREFAPAGSLADVRLPRGRAGAKALAEARRVATRRQASRARASLRRPPSGRRPGGRR